MIICMTYKTIISGETTVGNLIKEGDTSRREGNLMQAMKNYHAVWLTLSNSSESHEECVKLVDKEYKEIYRSMQGSRA